MVQAGGRGRLHAPGRQGRASVPDAIRRRATVTGHRKRPRDDVKGKAAKAEAQHAEVRASYELDCAKPEALDRMEVLLFDGFPSMKRLKAQTATPRGQGSATLSARKRTLAF